MSYRDIILDFIQYAFLLLLISFSLVFFLTGDTERMQKVIEFFKDLVPLSYFGIAFILSLKFYRKSYAQRRSEGELEITLYLTMFHKIIGEIIVFLIPITILALALFAGDMRFVDVLQALVAFTLAFFLHRLIFNKEANQ